MNTEDIEEKLDEIDLLMISNLDNNHFLIDENIILLISDMINKIQYEIIKNKEENNINLEKRFKIVAEAFMSARDKKTGVNEANKYFKWMENAKRNAEKKELSLKEALDTAKYEDETGHKRSEEVAKVLAKSYTPENTNPRNLPVKQSWFNKLKAKIKKFIYGNKQNANSNTSSIPIPPNPPKVGEKYANNKKQNNLFENLKPEYKDEIVVVSDLHGNLQKWEMVRKTLIKNPKRRLIIEGDAMDRGQFGVEILLQIKVLSDKGIVKYLPGNHDIFAYNYLATKGSQFENTNTHKYAERNWTANGGKVTLSNFENYNTIMESELRNGRISHRISRDELIEWLGRCPIQEKVYQNGITYALSHAMFDEELYKQNPNFNLRKALELELDGKKENMKTLNKFKNCMWYRENNSETHYSTISWPKGNIVVVGHTRQKEANIKYLGNDPNKPMIYLDCGNGKLQGFNLSTGHHEPIEENATKNPEISNERQH